LGYTTDNIGDKAFRTELYGDAGLGEKARFGLFPSRACVICITLKCDYLPLEHSDSTGPDFLVLS